MNPALIHLLQLASPTLPVGAYTYSQGLEWAVESGAIRDEASAGRWIADCLEHGAGRFEAVYLAHMLTAWRADDLDRLKTLDAEFLASRETAELRAETLQMGHSLARLLRDLGLAACRTLESPAANRPRRPIFRPFLGQYSGYSPAKWSINGLGGADFRYRSPKSDRLLGMALDSVRAAHPTDPTVGCAVRTAPAEISFPLAWSCAAAHWDIPTEDALAAYLWSWAENQVMAALKAVPLGQTAGQRLLLQLGEKLPELARQAATTAIEDTHNFLPAFAIASSLHENQYTRIFRS